MRVEWPEMSSLLKPHSRCQPADAAVMRKGGVGAVTTQQLSPVASASMIDASVCRCRMVASAVRSCIFPGRHCLDGCHGGEVVLGSNAFTTSFVLAGALRCAGEARWSTRLAVRRPVSDTPLQILPQTSHRPSFTCRFSDEVRRVMTNPDDYRDLSKSI